MLLPLGSAVTAVRSCCSAGCQRESVRPKTKAIRRVGTWGPFAFGTRCLAFVPKHSSHSHCEDYSYDFHFDGTDRRYYCCKWSTSTHTCTLCKYVHITYQGIKRGSILWGAILNRTYSNHKNLYIFLFLPTIFGPIYYQVWSPVIVYGNLDRNKTGPTLLHAILTGIRRSGCRNPQHPRPSSTQVGLTQQSKLLQTQLP